MESSTKSSQEKSTESTTVSGQEPKPATMVNNSQKVDHEAAVHPPKEQELGPATTDEAAVAKEDEAVKAEFEHDMEEELEAEDSESKTFGEDGKVKAKKSVVKKKGK